MMTQETTEMHVCTLSICLEKLNCEIMMSMLQNNWFMVSVRPSSYGCIEEVAKAHASWDSCSQFFRA